MKKEDFWRVKESYIFTYCLYLQIYKSVFFKQFCKHIIFCLKFFLKYKDAAGEKTSFELTKMQK